MLGKIKAFWYFYPCESTEQPFFSCTIKTVAFTVSVLVIRQPQPKPPRFLPDTPLRAGLLLSESVQAFITQKYKLGYTEGLQVMSRFTWASGWQTQKWSMFDDVRLLWGSMACCVENAPGWLDHCSWSAKGGLKDCSGSMTAEQPSALLWMWPAKVRAVKRKI